jgi:hypothetical protein
MRNSEKVKQRGYKPLFYRIKYCPDSHGRAQGGIATVCILNVGHDIIRGISFCDPGDQFVKKTGRDIVLGRAIQVLERNRDMHPIGPGQLVESLIDAGFTFFGEYNITLTDYEAELVEKAAKYDSPSKTTGTNTEEIRSGDDQPG